MNFIGIRSTLLRGLCGLGFYAFSALAQPTLGPRPIKVVVPVAAGGGADQVARLVRDKMSRSLGVPIVVDNRPGGSGSIAALEVARAAPDGYTLLLANMSHSLMPVLHSKLSFSPERDFVPVALTGLTGSVLVANTGVPVKTVRELVVLAKAQPG